MNFNKATVLIADDQAPMRKIIRTIVQHLGVKNIIEADDGREAWAKLADANKNLPPDLTTGFAESPRRINLIICDWNMPNMSGIELLRAVRADREIAFLPFLMVTAEGDQTSVVEAIECGVTDYIVKPFQAKILEEKLRKIVDPL